jgi:serine/threonine protein kinase
MRNEPQDPFIGIWILGQFHIIRAMASGGMSDVYLAEQSGMERYAAIKIVRGSKQSRQEWKQRLRQEARAASRLIHPNIVTVYNFGALADGSLFLAMEYVDGVRLADFSQKGPLPLDLAIDLTCQCARALSAAHHAGIIHRDFKPGNVIITVTGDRLQAKVFDFGIATFRDDNYQTSSSHLVGTPSYISPEQWDGKMATPASDQYALGLVFFSLLTGKMAVYADSLTDLLYQHKNITPLPPSQLNPQSPKLKQLDPIVRQMIAKDPQDRFASMDQVIYRLEQIAETLDEKTPREAYLSLYHELRSQSSESCGSNLPTTNDILINTSECPLPETAAITRSMENGYHVVVLGSRDVLSSEAWKILESHGIRLEYQGESLDELAQKTSKIDLWLLVTSEEHWQDAVAGWMAKGIPLEKALVCIDSDLSTPRLEAAAEMLCNFYIGKHPLEPLALLNVLKWLQRNKAGGMECIPKTCTVQLMQISSVAEKNVYTEHLIDDARAAKLNHRVIRSMTEISDEMISNAIHHAPRVAPGIAPPYSRNPASRYHQQQGKESIFRWAFSDPYIYLSIQDAFGSLSIKEALKRILGSTTKAEVTESRSGVGMGLFIMSRSAHHLFIGICPRSWCEIIALIHQGRPKEMSPKERTLCILQGLGRERTRAIGEKLLLKEIRHQSEVHFELEGFIDETADLSSIFSLSGRVYLDLAGIHRFNSAGIRAWIEASNKRNPTLDLVLERCTSFIISQFNRLLTLTEQVNVSSFMAPYYCEHCQSERIEVLFVPEIEDQKPPRRLCPRCQREMSFEEVPDEYFSFIETLPASSTNPALARIPYSCQREK